MKAIILARVSTEEQTEGQSIPAQLARAREYCLRKNLKIKSEHQFDESSTKDHRAKFEKVIEEIKESKEPLALIAETIDRIQRSFRESVILLDLIKTGKAEVHFIRENLAIHKDSNSSEFLRWDMGVMFARGYVLQLSDNVKRSLEQKRKNGEWTGVAPIGYKNIPLNEEKRLRKDILPDPENAHLVERLFNMHATGNYSIETLKREVDKMGLKTRNGKDMPKSSLHSMLRNPFYCGRMVCKGVEYPHKYKTLISVEIFEKCQKILDSYHTTHTKRAVKPFIFRGIIKCAKCGCSVTPETKKGKYIYYSCTNYRGKCKRQWVREEELLKPVHKALKSVQLPQKKIDAIVQYLKETNRAKKEFHREAINGLNIQYQKLQNRIDQLVDLLTDGSITKDIYDRKLNAWKEEQYEITHKLNNYTNADHQYHITANTVLNLAKRACEIFKSAEIDEKRQLLNFMLQNCRLNGRKLEFSLRKPFDTIAYAKSRPIGLRGPDSNRQPSP